MAGTTTPAPVTNGIPTARCRRSPDGAPASGASPDGTPARPPTDDDGTATRFVFAEGATLPAIYAVDEQHHEMLVTARRVGDGWVIDRVWRRYVLRAGKATAQARRVEPRQPR